MDSCGWTRVRPVQCRAAENASIAKAQASGRPGWNDPTASWLTCRTTAWRESKKRIGFRSVYISFARGMSKARGLLYPLGFPFKLQALLFQCVCSAIASTTLYFP